MADYETRLDRLEQRLGAGHHGVVVLPGLGQSEPSHTQVEREIARYRREHHLGSDAPVQVVGVYFVAAR